MNRQWLSHRLRSLFSLKYVRRRIPIVDWLPKYNLDCFLGDLIAGVTVGLTVIPQGIAYGDLAGLPLQYGLYTSFMGCFVYCLFGSVKQITIGPTAIMAIMVNQYVSRGGPEYAALMTFLCGIMVTLSGALNFGVLIDLVSVPVISGFVTAAAIIIGTSQIKSLLGLRFHAEGFISEWEMIVTHIGETRMWDCILGFSCIAVLISLKKLKESRWVRVSAESSRARKITMSGVRLLTTSRNIIVVFATIILAYLLTDYHPFILTGNVEPGLPSFAPPHFNIDTGNQTLSFGELLQDMGSGLIIIPVIAILETISIGKAFAKGKAIDASQEMIALGLSNILSSFVGAFPSAGSFSRTAVNATSGVCTPLGGIWTGVLVIIALQFLAPYFAYIPKAALAAVIIGAVIFMTEFKEALHIYKTRKIEILTWLLTFLCCLFLGIEFGIVIGVGFNLLLLLYHNARPKVTFRSLQENDYEYFVAKLDRSVHFPSVEYLRSVVAKGSCDHRICAVVLDMSSVAEIDFTAVKGLSALTKDFSEQQILVIFTHMESSVQQVLRSYQAPHLLHCHSLSEVPSMLKQLLKGSKEFVDTNGHPTSNDFHSEAVSIGSYVV